MGGDTGDIDILLKRSFDNARAWEPMQIIVHTGQDTDGNPAPVLDKEMGTIWLLFCKNLADGGEDLIVEGRAPRTVWVTSSKDDGQAWDEPREIAEDVNQQQWLDQHLRSSGRRKSVRSERKEFGRRCQWGWHRDFSCPWEFHLYCFFAASYIHATLIGGEIRAET